MYNVHELSNSNYCSFIAERVYDEAKNIFVQFFEKSAPIGITVHNFPISCLRARGVVHAETTKFDDV